MNCSLCDSDDILRLGRIPDSIGIIREIFCCNECYALLPNFHDEKIKRGIQLQVDFHETLWRYSSEIELHTDLIDLMRLVRSLQKYLGEPKGSASVVELGAGRGGLLKSLRLSGYDAHGCEPASELVGQARKYYGLGETVLKNADIDSFLSDFAQSRKFSAIILWHVLEHLQDPVKTLKRLTDIIIPDGNIIIQVPLLVPKHIYLEHYFFMTHRSFHYLADKLDLGLVKIDYDQENMFATAVYCKNAKRVCHSFRNSFSVPDPLSQLIFLIDNPRSSHKFSVSSSSHLNRRSAVGDGRVPWAPVEFASSLETASFEDHTIKGDDMSIDIEKIDVRIRSEKFSGSRHNRYWWYNLHDCKYLPPVFKSLSEKEWALMAEWFADSERQFSSPGEISIPGISFLSGLIGGNGLSRIVQCGHYAGYSSLLLGFLLRGMNKTNALFSVDIDPNVTAYTRGWLELADLSDVVELAVSDSADENVPDLAAKWLGGRPQIVFIDSSHQYDHTLRELECWFDHIEPGGFIIMHDVSVFAQQFDSTSRGGVFPAVQEWAARQNLTALLINQFVDGSKDPNGLVYKDGCGLGLVQKPW